MCSTRMEPPLHPAGLSQQPQSSGRVEITAGWGDSRHSHPAWVPPPYRAVLPETLPLRPAASGTLPLDAARKRARSRVPQRGPLASGTVGTPMSPSSRARAGGVHVEQTRLRERREPAVHTACPSECVRNPQRSWRPSQLLSHQRPRVAAGGPANPGPAGRAGLADRRG